MQTANREMMSSRSNTRREAVGGNTDENLPIRDPKKSAAAPSKQVSHPVIVNGSTESTLEELSAPSAHRKNIPHKAKGKMTLYKKELRKF